MKLHAPLALVGMTLFFNQPMLHAQDSKDERERAISAIKEMGGKVKVDSTRPANPVVGVDLSHTRIIDASLEHLKSLPTLQMLSLMNTPVTDDGIVYVKGLTNLEVLELRRTKVTDKSLANLETFTKIIRLDLGGTQVTDNGLVHLKGLTRLESLNLQDVLGITNLGLVHLKGMRRLRELNLAGTKVTEAGVRSLQQTLPQVTIKR